MSDLKQLIVDSARKFGADLVGFASVKRFEGVDQLHHPLSIFPECKTVIGLGYRVLRGSLRGIEEGTVYYQYTTMGIELLEENYMPRSMMRLCGVIEDAGYAAAPQKHHQMICSDEKDTNPEINYKRIYHVDMPQLDFAQAAVKCGLGEMGKSGQVLSDDFGPFQRFCFILTDAEIEESDLVSPHLCDDCQKCAKACHGQALEITEEGLYKLDNWQCSTYLAGASALKNPFLASDALSEIADRMAILRGEKKLTAEEAKEVMDQLRFYPPMKHAYATNVCGRACDRACYDHLEKEGKLSRSFKNPFRDQEQWSLSLDGFEK